MPRIIFISLEYAPVIGGAEKQTRTLAEKMAAAGFPVSVLTRWHKGLRTSEVMNGVEIHRIRTLWLPFFSWLSFTCGVLLFVNCHKKEDLILQAQILSVPALAAAGCGRLFNKPALVKLAAGGKGGNIDTLLHSRLGRYKFNLLKENLDYFVAINQEVRSELEQEGIVARRIKTLPNGVDTDLYQPATRLEKEKLKTTLGLGAGPVILYVGRLHQVKNLAVLIDSFALLPAAATNAQLLIIGLGPEEINLKKQIAAKDLTGKIVFIPMQEDVQPYFQAADIFVLPSQREGIANALLEAMASGLAPVASRVGGNKELIQDGTNGFLVEPGEAASLAGALSRLVSDEKLSRQFGVAARQKVIDHYGLAATVSGYRDIYSLMHRKYFKQQFPILAYHRIQEKPEYGMDVATADFSRQMDWLHRQGWQTISLDQIKECLDQDLALPAKSFTLTFDDGHKDNYAQALPILKRYGFSALIYLTAGYIGTTKYAVKTEVGRQWLAQKPATWQDQDTVNCRKFEFLSWEEIQEMKTAGWEFGAHTLSHPHLTRLSRQEQFKEIEDSKKLLENKLNTPIKHFCYPYQDYNQETEDLVRQAGFLTACYSPSHYDLRFYWDDLYALERIAIFGQMDLKKVSMLVTGSYQRWRRHLPAPVWDSLAKLRR